ncbi:uncharacterized protein LOC123274424 [Cotesia glomerata]|uniref:uncharacterized protein LOC123274424 n=1 Tax=Cotesia glomerata TaxID=32391 RepID=UPI001D01FB2B|nr:uncharacterized protein LOC123274424 [Cotesia glomerata]
MSLQSIIASFTDDEEIDEWVAGDDSVELKGYVDAIEGTKLVTSAKYPLAKPVPLYKIIINSAAQKRVRVVFWGADATKNSPLIHDGTIIELKRAKVTVGNPQFNNPMHRIEPLELYITTATKITFFEEKYVRQAIPVQILDMPLIYYKELEATVRAQGYLKQEFDPIKSYGTTTGAGVIVDGETKLPVRIKNFDALSTRIPRGTFLQVVGVVTTNTTGPPYLTVESMADVKICEEVAVLSSDVLSPMGRRPPSKRRGDFDSEVLEKAKLAKKME